MFQKAQRWFLRCTWEVESCSGQGSWSWAPGSSDPLFTWDPAKRSPGICALQGPEAPGEAGFAPHFPAPCLVHPLTSCRALWRLLALPCGPGLPQRRNQPPHLPQACFIPLAPQAQRRWNGSPCLQNLVFKRPAGLPVSVPDYHGNHQPTA